MDLDLSSFKRAIKQLENALVYCDSDLAKADAVLALHLRAAAIQAFEFNYELAIKMIKRSLGQIEASEATVRDMNFDDLIRRAWSAGWLNEEITQWRVFRKQRGTTSYTYDEKKLKKFFRVYHASWLKRVTFMPHLKNAKRHAWNDRSDTGASGRGASYPACALARACASLGVWFTCDW